MLVNPKYQDIKEKLDEASVAIDLVSLFHGCAWKFMLNVTLGSRMTLISPMTNMSMMMALHPTRIEPCLAIANKLERGV